MFMAAKMHIWQKGLCSLVVISLLTCLIYLFETALFVKSEHRVAREPRPIHKTEGGATQVLVLTYMRSGSSLTGDILQHMPGAFYVYEPLRMFLQDYKTNGTIKYVNGTIRKPPYTFSENAVDLLYKWFTCDISRLQVHGLLDKAFLGMSSKTDLYLQCMQRQKLRNITGKVKPKVCLNLLRKLCNHSPIRIIKTIRMTLNDVRQLMVALPNLKIIHLIRDPRATIHSQSKFGMCRDKRVCINQHCTSVENDILAAEELKNDYPKRLMTAFYENIARAPRLASKRMYNFCGGVYTDSAKAYIYNITKAGNPDNCVICTTRSNSTKHIDSWKIKMPVDFINMVQERCNFVLKKLKYDLFDSNL